MIIAFLWLAVILSVSALLVAMRRRRGALFVWRFASYLCVGGMVGLWLVLLVCGALTATVW